MSRCAFFVSAPTVRFLDTIGRLRLLGEAQRRKIAATVLAEIKPFMDAHDRAELGGAAGRAQDQRWRLISQDAGDMRDPHFASVFVTEQWLTARLEVVRAASPIAELLADKRCAAVEAFITENVPAETFEVVQLFPDPPQPREDGPTRSAA
jgi:hypothetical protein